MKDVNILINNGVNVQASLELLGDMEMYDETLNDFLDLVNEKVSKLEKFKAENDMPNYAIEVHALKSDARYLGFLQLGDLAYDSEMKSKAGDTAGVEANHPNVIAQVTNMVNIACAYLGRSVEGFSGGSASQNVETAPASQEPTLVQPQVQPQVMVQPQMPVNPQPIMQPQQVATPQPVVQPMPQQVINPQVTQVQQDPQMMVQPQMPVSPQPIMQPQQVATPQPVVQPMPQVNQVYDLMTGQMINEPMPANAQVTASPLYGAAPQMMTQPQMSVSPQSMVQQPMQPTMDPMSQALYQQQQQATHQMPTNLAPKEGTILVVDDSNLVANFVRKIFNVRYDVVIANDGAKAIELCQDDNFRKNIKACLLDLNMPNVDGYQVLEDFKQKGYFVKMPVAVISGVEDLESIDRVNNYPIIDILAKPFNERDVQRVVEKCLAAYF